MMEVPKRKNTRLGGYDYSRNGAYFVTICTHNRECLLGGVGADVIQSFKRRSTIEYIKLVKAGSLPPFDGHIWQRSFHDHIIRNEQDYLEIWRYIDENPRKWKEDCFYCDE